MTGRIKAAIIGSGNIGTDLMVKIMRHSDVLEMAAFVGIDPASDGLARAARLGVAHGRNNAACAAAGKVMVDLTPAAIGPYVVPVVNGDAHLTAQNVNMVTCGGQATIPIVAAVSEIATVHYAEIVASIASRSAGPGTRANIDEFTETPSLAIERVGGAERGKAIIILNPAEPPMMMRDTVMVLSSGADEAAIAASVETMVARVNTYVPGYRLKQPVQFERFGSNEPVEIPGLGFEGIKTSVFLEVEGAAHYLPAYAGNLDVMTSAALQTGERIAARLLAKRAA